MPRINPSTLLKASHENPLLPLLLKECRTLSSARNELRWLRDHARAQPTRHHRHHNHPPKPWQTRLAWMARLRSRGYPLQYILGDQPFGDLEILCRPGVLIPRPDTESYVQQAAKLVKRLGSPLINDNAKSHNHTHKPGAGAGSNHAAVTATPTRIIDLCTGTGCITLLLHALLAPHFENLRIIGIDISPAALNLARTNLKHNLKSELLDSSAEKDIQFLRADVLGLGGAGAGAAAPNVEDILKEYQLIESDGPAKIQCDLLISNPPYISTKDFRNGTTAKSVRLFEPKLALVPDPGLQSQSSQFPAGTPLQKSEGENLNVLPQDIFYRHILELSHKLRTKLTVLECGDIEQAERVVELHTAIAEHSEGIGRCFDVQIWPNSEADMQFYGFHPGQGSRCVIIQRDC